MRSLIFLKIILRALLLCSTLPSYANDYAQGYSKYITGDYQGAEKIFTQALNRAKENFDKARIAKMLGICQYMLGKRTEAEQSFKIAKQAKPNIVISSSEILDESILAFFAEIPGPNITLPKESESKRTKILAHDEEPTILKVKIAPADATLFINNQQILNPLDPIRVQGGHNIIMAKAEGYFEYRQKVWVRKGVTNQLAINLEPQPKVEPSPAKPKVAEKIKPEAQPTKTISKKSRKNKPALIKPQIDNWVKFTPLGIGLFMEDRPVTGAFFALAQLGSGYMSYSNWTSAEALVTDFNNKKQARADAITALPDGPEKDAAIDKYNAENNETLSDIDKKNRNFYTFAGVAAGAYILSVIACYIVPNEDSHLAKKENSSIRLQPFSLDNKIGLTLSLSL